VTLTNTKPEVVFNGRGRHLEIWIWRHISAVGASIWTKLGNLVQNNMQIAENWSRSKPEVEFQYGGRVYFETGSSYISAAKGHIFKATMVKVRTTVGTWETLPHGKFCKNCSREYTHFGHIPKITNFYDFGGSKPTFFKPLRKNLTWGCNPGRPSLTSNSVKIC